MRNFWENPFFSITVLLFFATGLFLTLVSAHGAEILFLNAYRAEPLNTFFRLTTKLGEAHAYFVFGIAALFVRPRFALLIALTGLTVMPVSYILKDKIAHDRPITWFENVGLRDRLVLVPAVELASGRTSFPSGHTMSAFALFSMLTMAIPRKFQWLGLLTAYTAIMVAVSRVFLVQHFLIDILAGATVGLGIGWAMCRLGRLDWFQK